jgi:hypothetical protein
MPFPATAGQLLAVMKRGSAAHRAPAFCLSSRILAQLHSLVLMIAARSYSSCTLLHLALGCSCCFVQLACLVNDCLWIKQTLTHDEGLGRCSGFPQAQQAGFKAFVVGDVLHDELSTSCTTWLTFSN